MQKMIRMMKKTILIAASILTMAGCGNRNANKAAEENMVENGRIGYADLVSFICQGYECNWADMSPEEQGLSQVYSYSSEFAGFAEQDIDGDGIPELLLGDEFENGTVMLYDIYTINPEDGSLIHLAKGGERDTFTINGAGIIVENGSNSAFDSFQRAYKLQDRKLVELKEAAWEDSALIIRLEKFAKLAAN